MNARNYCLLLGLGFFLAGTAVPASAEDKVEVLARGPVHEAYAEPTEREPVATPVINKEPPKPIEELPPDQKPEGDNVQWIPGYWSYDEDRKDYLWVSGFWRVAPPGRNWMPGSWRKAGDGWQWTGGMWTVAKDQKAEVEYLPKPPAPLDNDGANTPAPSQSHVYVPGSWVWRDRYVWRPGFWMEHRDGWVWTSSHYRWTPAGYVYVDGYWDYPLATRGVLFAPVYIPPAVYAEPAFVYTPTVYVREECLFGAFFARRGYGSYYFGDYFAPAYASVGFVSWCGYSSATVRIGGFYDPLFSYYSCGYRRDPFWGGGGCVSLYAGRYRGDYARPPQTLVQQTTVINNITNINNSKNNTINVNNSNLNNVTMLQSIRDTNRDGRRFQTVAETDRTQQQTAARDLRATAARRADAETTLVNNPPKGGNGPRTVGLEVPPTRTIRSTPPAKGGPGVGTGTPITGMGTPGTGTPPKGGNTEPLPPRATPITGKNNTPPTGGVGGTGTGTLPMPKIVNPGTGTGNPAKGPNLNPPKIGNPPTGGMGGTGIGTNPPLTPRNPPTINNPPTGGMGTPVIPKNPPTINNPPTIGNPPKGTGTGTPIIPKNPPTISNPPTTLPPPRTTPPPVSTPPRVTPPPVSTPPRTTPPATTPPTRPAPPPKAAPKTKTSFAPAPITNTPSPIVRSVAPPVTQSRPLTVPPVTAPRIAPRPAISAPVVAPRPAMVNPRPIATPRIAPPVSRPAVTPRVAPTPAPRPAATPPSGAGRRPVRR